MIFVVFCLRRPACHRQRPACAPPMPRWCRRAPSVGLSVGLLRPVHHLREVPEAGHATRAGVHTSLVVHTGNAYAHRARTASGCPRACSSGTSATSRLRRDHVGHNNQKRLHASGARGLGARAAAAAARAPGSERSTQFSTRCAKLGTVTASPLRGPRGWHDRERGPAAGGGGGEQHARALRDARERRRDERASLGDPEPRAHLRQLHSGGWDYMQEPQRTPQTRLGPIRLGGAQ